MENGKMVLRPKSQKYEYTNDANNDVYSVLFERGSFSLSLNGHMIQKERIQLDTSKPGYQQGYDVALDIIKDFFEVKEMFIKS